MGWYARHGRDLPWRGTRDPYRIWISEVILQQTRVAQGLEYFRRFMERFPDVRTLAGAPEDEVMRYWQGLGYYSRARNLHAAAQEIVERHGGEFPRDYAQVLALKGIGEYTAAAVCSFAWGMPYAVVDGNVYRVLSRFFGIDTPIDSGKGKAEFAELAQEVMDRRSPDVYNQAIMDFGAVQCTPKAPACLYCPLRDGCRALTEGRVEQLPVKQGYEFPLVETAGQVDFAALQESEEYLRLMDGAGTVLVRAVTEMPKHVLSHRVIYAVFYELEVERFSPAMGDFVQVAEEEAGRYAVSRLIDLYRERRSL